MLGSALYYPFIDVRDRRWLRSAVLFWDEIQTIVPSSIATPYQNEDTRICQEEGYLRPLYCDFRPDILEELGKKVLSLLERPEWLTQLSHSGSSADPSIRALQKSESIEHDVRDNFHFAGIYPEKMTPQLREAMVKMGVGRLHSAKIPDRLKSMLLEQNPGLSHLHPSKMSGELKRLFGYRAEYEGDWFLVDSRFAQVYMAALAAMLAKGEGLSPLTTRESYQGVNLRYLIDDVAGDGERDATGVLPTLVMEGLRVDPDAPIQKLIAFRRNRGTQLAELSGTFDDLRASLEKSESRRELEQTARRIVENKIRPGLEKLKKELSDQAIQSGWEGFYQAATITAASGSVLATYTELGPAALLGASAFFTTANVGLKSVFAGRKARAESPYTYLLDIERKFSLPVWMR